MEQLVPGSLSYSERIRRMLQESERYVNVVLTDVSEGARGDLTNGERERRIRVS